MDLTAVKPLTYGVIRRNKDVVDRLTAPTLDLDQRIEASIAFLKLGFPEATEDDFDEVSPVGILMAGQALYKATFSRPEAEAPVQTNP